MKYTVIFILLALLGTSCASSKRCARLYPPSVIKVDSIVYRDKIVVHDTTITVRLPADTIYAEVQIPVNRILEPVTIETRYAKATASIAGERIKLTLIQKDAEIQVHIDSAKVEATYWREKYNTDKQTIIVPQKFVPKVTKWLAFFGGGCLIFILAYIAFRVFKK